MHFLQHGIGEYLSLIQRVLYSTIPLIVPGSLMVAMNIKHDERDWLWQKYMAANHITYKGQW